MESLSEIPWDVVISGTGLQQSLLALSLSRSGKKILHVDANDYYGGVDAAFSLQEAEEWDRAIKLKDSAGLAAQHFTATEIVRSDVESENEAGKLSFSRAYTLSLSPQIIYARSKLLSQLVSSKVYRQLEFQAVGNWWIYEASPESADGVLRRLPNGREDVFTDKGIDLRAKRSLMKFLKFVVDYENQTDIWQAHAADALPDFLAHQFQLPASLQTVITALTLSLSQPQETTVEYSLPRIARHLTSIGVFGPGFGAVLPKWGGGSEISQVACRAGAVGGGVYILGTGVKNTERSADSDSIKIALTNDETVHTKMYVDSSTATIGSVQAVKSITIVSSPLSRLFATTVEGAPIPAVTVVVFPAGSLTVAGTLQTHPVYITVHSSETGECPQGQCILYATTMSDSAPAASRLRLAIETLLQTSGGEGDPAKILWQLNYTQRESAKETVIEGNRFSMPQSGLDLAFNDGMLDTVEEAWKMVMESGSGLGADQPEQAEVSLPGFMQFEERAQVGQQDDDD